MQITKKCALVRPPNFLMVHLQKIIFDLSSLMNKKISDKYEFPDYLDLEPFHLANIMAKYGIHDDGLHPDVLASVHQNFHYRLIGVVIHSGVADRGHYISLINTDRNKKGNPWANTTTQTWQQFDDSVVSSYSMFTSFEKDTFGGASSHSYDYSAWQDSGQGQHSKSAYMLVYERQERSPMRMVVDDTMLEASRQIQLEDAQRKKQD